MTNASRDLYTSLYCAALTGIIASQTEEVGRFSDTYKDSEGREVYTAKSWNGTLAAYVPNVPHRTSELQIAECALAQADAAFSVLEARLS